jgi:hypothetical protein
MVSRFMQNPHDNHWKETKRILRYLQGTLHYGVFYSSKASISLLGYTNSDWVGDTTDKGLLQDMSFILVQVQFHGPVRS